MNVFSSSNKRYDHTEATVIHFLALVKPQNTALLTNNTRESAAMNDIKNAWCHLFHTGRNGSWGHYTCRYFWHPNDLCDTELQLAVLKRLKFPFSAEPSNTYASELFIVYLPLERLRVILNMAETISIFCEWKKTCSVKLFMLASFRFHKQVCYLFYGDSHVALSQNCDNKAVIYVCTYIVPNRLTFTWTARVC